ncbi:MAG TPA: phenylacetate--CoA ligase [Kiritimatiellia bacterium]|nr:phenylacetate--CoA ligase [Kiritimatiellia bacterium]HRZ12477.1 phenylacetate--CoA ligase [Kiritimatiellia bacterium]HSA17765.1 phenylacetate--CoA ligase [Kiritimatiellia bacterium]
MIFNKTFECMDRAALRNLQGERLRDAVKRAYEHVPFYRSRLDAHGVKPSDIHGIEDIVKLPFTTKEDFRDTYPFGLFAVPLREIVRVHASSGTTGKPTVVGYTKEDIDTWAETIARTLGCGGGTADDILQVAYGYGLFTGGLGLHYGGEKLGAMVIPMSGGNTKKQIMLMQDFGTTLLACTPSYSLQIAEEAAADDIDLKALKLRVGYFGAEPWTEAMRAKIEERLPVKAIDIYGLSEVMGPGVASECLEQDGLHVFEDHYFPEIINPTTGEPVAAGQKGELVYTCLTKRSTPLLRYRTRDISSLDEKPCPCGRTSRRMARITGRTDDMLIIRGVNVFPSQIETVLMKVEGIEPHYVIVVDKTGALDELEIKVEVSEQLFSDEIRKLEELRARIFEEMRSVLSLSAKITLVEPKTIERTLGKAKRVIDKREVK